MTATTYAALTMILAGVIILVISLVFASRIITELPLGSVRRWWSVLRALIVVFVFGYAASLSLLPRGVGAMHLVMSAVFFSGAVFVLLVCRLMLFTVRDVRRIAALELENVTDPLLGIYNRRYMEQRLREEIARATRYEMPLSLIVMDIDHFKRINDSYGHPIGDEVLKGIGELLRNTVREVDLFARYGGEEFVVILPNTRAEEALVLAERLRVAVEKSKFVVESGGRLELDCTVSLGLSTTSAGARDSKTLLSEADRALYQAKVSGRNRVQVYSAQQQAA